jgi:hypothetical protein
MLKYCLTQWYPYHKNPIFSFTMLTNWLDPPSSRFWKSTLLPLKHQFVHSLSKYDTIFIPYVFTTLGNACVHLVYLICANNKLLSNRLFQKPVQVNKVLCRILCVPNFLHHIYKLYVSEPFLEPAYVVHT